MEKKNDIIQMKGLLPRSVYRLFFTYIIIATDYYYYSPIYKFSLSSRTLVYIVQCECTLFQGYTQIVRAENAN